MSKEKGVIRIYVEPSIFAQMATTRAYADRPLSVLQAAMDNFMVEILPVPVPAAWSGSGLPPVGIECEVVAIGYSNPRSDRFIGQRVTIVAHDEIDGDRVAVFRMPIDGQEWEQDYHALVEQCFRPIRTAEQIAADEREKAVKEMLADANPVGHMPKYTFDLISCLYDAGYRKIT